MSITSFEKVDNNQKLTTKNTIEFETEYFKITLPEKWEFNGKQKPYYNQEYYLYQSKVPNADNRWLKVYVNNIPQDFALNRLLPIVVNGNRVNAQSMSGDCKKFQDSPKKLSSQKWQTSWQEVPFVCDLSGSNNQVGTGLLGNGYSAPISGQISGQNNYFFVYTDQNIKPDYKILVDAVNSIVVL